MTFQKTDDFYTSYNEIKGYETPVIKKKQLRWYDTEYWYPTSASAETSVLEIGSGAGEFLSYLEAKGVQRYLGIERDAKAVEVLPAHIRAKTQIADIWDFLKDAENVEKFDHIVMLDVLEHFSPIDGANLLVALEGLLAKEGLIYIRVPNMGSPWGGMHQYADLTHIAAYGPGNLAQLATATGYHVTKFLPQTRGPWIRRRTQAILHAVLARMLVSAPVVWTPNLIAILKRGSS